METYNLTHLKALEAEAIHIIREVAAEFRNPVMLYSIGKDSSVMVRLAEKAFYPGRVPFPLMHIDSKWKFREMIEFRDRYAAEQIHVAANNQKEAPHASVDGDSARAYRVCGNTAAHCYSALRCYAHTYARPVRIG